MKQINFTDKQHAALKQIAEYNFDKGYLEAMMIALADIFLSDESLQVRTIQHMNLKDIRGATESENRGM
jgi:hypothetical protein